MAALPRKVSVIVPTRGPRLMLLEAFARSRAMITTCPRGIASGGDCRTSRYTLFSDISFRLRQIADHSIMRCAR